MLFVFLSVYAILKERQVCDCQTFKMLRCLSLSGGLSHTKSPIYNDNIQVFLKKTTVQPLPAMTKTVIVIAKKDKNITRKKG